MQNARLDEAQAGIKIARSVSQSVQSLSPVRLFATPWTAARQASLSITNSHLNAEFQRIARRDKKAFLSDHPAYLTYMQSTS